MELELHELEFHAIYFILFLNFKAIEFFIKTQFSQNRVSKQGHGLK